MASTSIDQQNFHNTVKHFPPVINGRINTIDFLEASDNLVKIVERLGTVFAPVKYDMQGNIDKIKKVYKYDENSCLLELMLEENKNGKPIAAEGVLWLNRAFLFFELAFAEVVKNVHAHNFDINLNKILAIAYEASVKKYHNWVTQQIFALICKMSPTLSQLIKSLGAENNVKEFGSALEQLNITMHLVRCKIDDFFKDNDLNVGQT